MEGEQERNEENRGEGNTETRGKEKQHNGRRKTRGQNKIERTGGKNEEKENINE